MKTKNTSNVKDSRYFIDNIEIKKGSRSRINISMGSVYDLTDVNMPIEVIRGKNDGPTLFVSSTIHGDEINGIEIVRRLLSSKELRNINGMLIAIPIVNIFGFNDRSRYLPDRRDLNRCFPGIKNGSLASQLAYKFIKEIVDKSDFGIDLHTGSFHRSNYPHVRANIKNQEMLELAKQFGTSIILDSNLRDGSLRAAVSQKNIPMILYEAGEALRLDEKSVEIGVNGILNIMRKIGMIQSKNFINKTPKKQFIAHYSSWLRASQSGIYISKKNLGDVVKKDEILGEILGPFGNNKKIIKSHENGIIVGMSLLPLANKGDALFNIACKNSPKDLIKNDNFDLDIDKAQDNLEKIDFVNL